MTWVYRCPGCGTDNAAECGCSDSTTARLADLERRLAELEAREKFLDFAHKVGPLPTSAMASGQSPDSLRQPNTGSFGQALQEAREAFAHKECDCDDCFDRALHNLCSGVAVACGFDAADAIVSKALAAVREAKDGATRAEDTLFEEWCGLSCFMANKYEK